VKIYFDQTFWQFTHRYSSAVITTLDDARLQRNTATSWMLIAFQQEPGRDNLQSGKSTDPESDPVTIRAAVSWSLSFQEVALQIAVRLQLGLRILDE